MLHFCGPMLNFCKGSACTGASTSERKMRQYAKWHLVLVNCIVLSHLFCIIFCVTTNYQFGNVTWRNSLQFGNRGLNLLGFSLKISCAYDGEPRGKWITIKGMKSNYKTRPFRAKRKWDVQRKRIRDKNAARLCWWSICSGGEKPGYIFFFFRGAYAGSVSTCVVRKCTLIGRIRAKASSKAGVQLETGPNLK